VVLVGYLRVAQFTLLVRHLDLKTGLNRLFFLPDRLSHIEFISLITTINGERNESLVVFLSYSLRAGLNEAQFDLFVLEATA